MDRHDIDTDLLKQILEMITYWRNNELECIGIAVRHHTIMKGNTDSNDFETGKNIYENCQVTFKQISELDADLRKIDQMIGTISKLASKYLD